MKTSIGCTFLCGPKAEKPKVNEPRPIAPSYTHGPLYLERKNPNVINTFAFVRLTDTFKTTQGLGFDGRYYSPVIDLNNPFWDETYQAYVLGPSEASMMIPVKCLHIGAFGNVPAGAIQNTDFPIMNIEYWINPTAFTNGHDVGISQTLQMHK
jgi:hypothetical protein